MVTLDLILNLMHIDRMYLLIQEWIIDLRIIINIFHKE
jgi:hypothetical protein